MGGLSYSANMAWAQIFPFVALQFFEDKEMKGAITIFLICCLALWLLMNIIFFCTIDLSYLNTFFGTMTAPQYTCMLYKTAEDDSQRWDAAFTNRFQYTTKIHSEVKEWVALKIERWKVDKPDFFNIEMIPDELLPKEVFETEGGKYRRRRSSVSLREIAGFDNRESSRVHPA